MRVLAVTAHSDRPETEMFIGLRDAGVHLEVMCPDDAPHRHRLVDSGIEVHASKLVSRFDRRGCAAIRQRLIDGQFDILHGFNNRAVSNGLRATRGLDVRFVAYRGIEGNVSVLDPISWTTYLNPRVDRIICVADAIRRTLVNLKLPGWKFPAERAVTIYKGHDLGWYQSPPVSRAELGIPDEAFVVGCTANERPRKGLPLLIDATAMLASVPDIHILLIGHVTRKKTFASIARSPIPERIHLAGYRDDAPRVLGSCNVCILPAIKREGLPKGIIEGMAYGLAPIVTDSGGSPELVEPGESGLVIPPGSSSAIADAILSLSRDRQGCARMGLAARARIETHFHISETIRQTLALYHELTDQN